MESLQKKSNFFGKIFLKHLSSIFLLSNVFVSGGILLVTSGGSWDITNHLLNKPETFFSPPHAMMYSGVALSLIATTVAFFTWRKFEEKTQNYFKFPVLITLIGIAILVSAGPIDFVWHSNFGLDGLLSPPHLILIFGMILVSVGALVSIARFINQKIEKQKNNFLHFLMAVAIVPVWLSGTGLIYSLTLPFSQTEFYNFNPEPNFAIIFATISLPFLVSFSLLVSCHLAHSKFGVLSAGGFVFLFINCLTSIVTNDSIHHTIPFYFLNIIPFVITDMLVSRFHHQKLMVLAGGILGLTFYMVFYPLPTYTYNEILLQKMVWPSIIAHIYFEMISVAYPIVAAPAIIFGILGGFLAKKIKPKILSEI